MRLVFLVIFGLVWGSFLNVVIYRLPLGLSLAKPPSSCPRCGARIRPYDNIPVLSYLLLGGKCRRCRASISPVYPLVESLTAGSFVLAFF
ncbi:MAG: prepilin peptidase, partial [Candidatus Aminicenantes bacterium]|nr:prepilin peptidase [Candidatus Aminicenantes bacterium]